MRGVRPSLTATPFRFGPRKPRICLDVKRPQTGPTAPFREPLPVATVSPVLLQSSEWKNAHFLRIPFSAGILRLVARKPAIGPFAATDITWASRGAWVLAETLDTDSYYERDSLKLGVPSNVYRSGAFRTLRASPSSAAMPSSPGQRKRLQWKGT